MLPTDWLTNRPRPRPRVRKVADRRRRNVARLVSVLDSALEDRCLLSTEPAGNVFPTANSDLSQVFYTGVTGSYQKTITITNNSPTETIYPFLESKNDRQAIAPYAGTGAFDPFDPANQEYRGYIGYKDGAADRPGLPPLSSITITVPLVEWDSGRIIFSTDGADQFATYGGPDGGSPAGAPFYYQDMNTQATYFGSIDAGNLNTLNFTPVYNGFDAQNGGVPTTAGWKSPITAGILKNGQTFILSGPGIPGGSEQVTIDSSHPNSITLPTAATGASTVGQYTFTALPGAVISPTARSLQTGFTLTTQGSPSTTNGEVLWYHALQPQNINNDAPAQLTEVSFRGTFYDPKINIGTGFQYLLGSAVLEGADTNSADYDISFVDSINMPIAMEANNVTVGSTGATAPFGWVGSSQSLSDFRAAVTAFTSTNPDSTTNANSFGTYFTSTGEGYPGYVPIDPGDTKLPAGQNLFLASPAIGGAADIKFYKAFSDGTSINQPLYALTSGGTGPISLLVGGDASHPSSGNNLGLNTSGMASDYALTTLMLPNLLNHIPYAVTYLLDGKTVSAGNAIAPYYDPSDGKTVIGVVLDQPVPANAANLVFTFSLPQTDYAAGRIAGLWYTWAKYYADNVQSTPMTGVPGKITLGNTLTLNDAAPGLVPGMAVTGAGVPAGCVILSIASDQKTIKLSTTVAQGSVSFDFAAPAFNSIVGFDKNPNSNTPLVDLNFDAADKAYALSFAETIYVVMSAWSASVPAATPNGWDPLMVNIIGGNLGLNYLPNANLNVVNTLTNMSKSALRGVPDYTSPLYSNPAQWYPDPALAAGGQTFNVFNLDPFVWLIHDKLGLTAYAFALDDDIGNVNAGGATELDISVGGLNGLPNKDPYTNVSPWGVVTSGSADTTNQSSQITGFTNPTALTQIAQFDYSKNTPGTLINGPGVPRGTTAQFTSISDNSLTSTITLSNPLTSAATSPSFAFFGALTFTGTVLGAGQADDTILLNSQDAYNTLLKFGPLQNIQVTGEGIDPSQTVTIESLTRDPQSGVITLLLHGHLNSALVSQRGGYYAYTFGSAVVGVIRDPSFEWAGVQKLGGQYNHGDQLSQNTKDWTFTDDTKAGWLAGIAYSNSSDYTSKNPLPPDALQVGFVQGDSSISQTFILGSGVYTLSLHAAQSGQNQGRQTVTVLIDNKPVGTIDPKDTNYELISIPINVGAGQHTIEFQGVNKTADTVLLDEVQANVPTGPASVPGPIELNTIPNEVANEGAVVSFTASVVNPSPTLMFSLDPGAPAGATIDPVTGVFHWTAGAPGQYAVTVRVSDSGSPERSTIQTVSITVANLAPAIFLSRVVAPTQPAGFFDAGSFVDATPGSFVGEVDYGDGKGFVPLALDPDGDFVLSHKYTHPGTYTVTVDVKDPLGAVGTSSVTLKAAAVPLVSGVGRGRDAFVATLYLKDLGRTPDVKGLKFWSRQLAAGVPPKAVARRFWTSAERRELASQRPIAPTTFQQSYANALAAGRLAAKLHLHPLVVTVTPPSS